MITSKIKLALVSLASCWLCQCASTSYGPPNMGGPTAEARAAAIAAEPTGDFFYGRRYHVYKTRFWGYLREPRQPASQAKLVFFQEDFKKAPDRLPEDGPSTTSFGFDNNYQYRIRGYYTGKEAYDPNSNQFLPVFMLKDYELVDQDPGWLFSPADHSHPRRVTLLPR